MRISDWSSDVCSSDLRVRLARDVIIGRKVDDRGDAVTEPLPNVGNRRSDAILRAEIEVDCDGAVGRFRGYLEIKPHDGVESAQPEYHRGPDAAAGPHHADIYTENGRDTCRKKGRQAG